MSGGSARRRIVVVTGSRAEFGLLRPVMLAIESHSQLELRVVVAGSHLLPPALTMAEVEREFEVAARIPMQAPGRVGRPADAAALGLGVRGFAECFEVQRPDIVLLLGDRLEPFAAAAAAAAAGLRIAHMHGGDRAEGVADESFRHAITKLAHVHLPATQVSALRIVAMGEDPDRIHIVGSPAIDGLDSIPPMSDPAFNELGRPQIVVLVHPVGDPDECEHGRMAEVLRAVRGVGRALVLHPNHDAGRDGVLRAIEESGCRHVPHLPRDAFVGLMRRAGVIVGNSSAGLIECAALSVRCVNLGTRQAGREAPANVSHLPEWDYQTLVHALDQALQSPCTACRHPYGDGRAGPRTADRLASIDLKRHGVRKRNTY